MSIEDKLGKIENTLSGMEVKISHVETSVDRIEKTVESKYVTREEFQPVKLVTYGWIAIVTTGVVTSIVSLVMR